MEIVYIKDVAMAGNTSIYILLFHAQILNFKRKK